MHVLSERSKRDIKKTDNMITHLRKQTEQCVNIYLCREQHVTCSLGMLKGLIMKAVLNQTNMTKAGIFKSMYDIVRC